ncbi:MAG: folate-binding protein [Alcaligenaceae bacterium]
MHPILALTATTEAQRLPATLTIYPLEDFAVFDAVGADAQSFLQGQLTNDIASTGPNQARLAGYCTAQGRLLATMVMAKLPDTNAQEVSSSSTLIGLIRKDILPAVLKRLGMFVLRAKAKLTPSAYQVVGVSIAANQCPALSLQLGHALPQAAWEMIISETGVWICAPTASSASAQQNVRWWWLANDTHLAACRALGLRYTLERAEDWQSQDITAGLPWIEAGTQDLLIPQTLNLDLIDGVSFTKGCYPGQEIVARSHYRGTVKRRMHFGTIEQTQALDLRAGVDIFDARGSEQACGRVINVTQVTDRQTTDSSTAYLLFETTFEALEHDALHLGARDGAAIKLAALPYSTIPG